MLLQVLVLGSHFDPKEAALLQHPIAEMIVAVLAIYGAIGVIFAVPFLWRGLGRLDATAKEGTWGFKAVIFPGVVALWPVLLLKLLRAIR